MRAQCKLEYTFHHIGKICAIEMGASVKFSTCKLGEAAASGI